MKLRKRTWISGGKKQTAWVMDYTNPLTGQRERTMIKGVTSKAEAEAVATKRFADLHRAKEQGETSTMRQTAKLGTLGDLFNAHVARSTISPMTAKFESGLAKNLKDQLGANILAKSITTEMLDEYVRIRRAMKKHPSSDKPVSDATILKELKHLRQAFNWGVDRGLCSPPRFKLPALAPETKKARCLTREEMVALLEACGPDTAPLRQVVEFCYLAGLRRSELYSLKWSNLDLDNAALLMLTKKRGRSATMRRDVIYLSTRAMQILDARREYLGGDPDPDSYIFGITDRPRGGKGLIGQVETPNDQEILTKIHRAAARAGIKNPLQIGMHTLRHSCATHLLEASATVPEAAAHLRHRDGGALLLRTYAHAHETGLRAATERLSPSQNGHKKKTDAE